MNCAEANIPARLHARTWDDFEKTDPVLDVKMWAKNFPEMWLPPTADPDNVGRGLLLHGRQGTGKTTAAALALKDVIETGKAGWFVPVPSLENLVHRQMDLSTYLRKVESIDIDTQLEFEAIGQRLMKIRMRYFVVVLDDWGRERMGAAFMQDYVEGLLRERFNRGLPTILTTNLDEDEIDAALSPPFVSFLHEACMFVDFGKHDRRRDRRAGR